MTDLVLQSAALERTAAGLAEVRDGLEACARVLGEGAGAGLGSPELDAACAGLAQAWGRGAAVLAREAGAAQEQVRQALGCFAAADRALVPPS